MSINVETMANGVCSARICANSLIQKQKGFINETETKSVKKRFSAVFEESTFDRLDKLSIELGTSRNAVAEMAIVYFCNEVNRFVELDT